MKNVYTLDDLNFDNRFINNLPADSQIQNVCRQVYGACYSKVLPTPVPHPLTMIVSPVMAGSLDLSMEECLTDDFAHVFAGNRLAKGMEAYATCYGGHQFGQWAGQLGDGRVINLGEVVNQSEQRLTLQLKGAGKTPYSRHSDGLAVLRSSVREFLCSEAMFHLGVPTTRALSLVLTGKSVIRDMFYNGNPQYEQGAIVCRVAPSFTRFGHFQLFAARNELSILKVLVDYTIQNDFSGLGSPSKETYLKWFHAVCQRTAEMIVHWQRVGFVHGVMNTDNMSILGLTIDYGPYGWLENVDLDWTPNITDVEHRRYRFGWQPRIAFWNLAQLANAIYPLIKEETLLQQILEQSYTAHFQRAWQRMMVNKLGLASFRAETDDALISDLLTMLQKIETDMTLFYRQLAQIDMSIDIETVKADDGLLSQWLEPLDSVYYCVESRKFNVAECRLNWLARYQQRLRAEGVDEGRRIERMNAINPLYVPRNYLLQTAIEHAEQGDFDEVRRLYQVFEHPYTKQSGYEQYAQKRPDWAKQKAGCSMLSCSS